MHLLRSFDLFAVRVWRSGPHSLSTPQLDVLFRAVYSPSLFTAISVLQPPIDAFTVVRSRVPLASLRSYVGRIETVSSQDCVFGLQSRWRHRNRVLVLTRNPTTMHRQVVTNFYYYKRFPNASSAYLIFPSTPFSALCLACVCRSALLAP